MACQLKHELKLSIYRSFGSSPRSKGWVEPRGIHPPSTCHKSLCKVSPPRYITSSLPRLRHCVQQSADASNCKSDSSPAHTAHKLAASPIFGCYSFQEHEHNTRHTQLAASGTIILLVASILVMAQAGTPTDEQAPHSTAETPPSIQGHLSNSTPTDAFVDFVRRKKAEYKGRDGRGKEQNYVPHTELYTYWTDARIREACQSYSEGITTRHNLIRSRFLRVFSTLVYIGKLSYIPAFQQNGLCDQRFPDTTLPGSWIHSPCHGSMFDDFKEHQWIFFPVILNRDSLENTSLPPERILPLSIEETIRSQSHIDRAAITKVRFHPSCNELVNVSWRTKTINGNSFGRVHVF